MKALSNEVPDPNIQRPRGVVEIGVLCVLIVDDALTKTDVGNQFHASPQGVHYDHNSKKFRGQSRKCRLSTGESNCWRHMMQLPK